MSFPKDENAEGSSFKDLMSLETVQTSQAPEPVAGPSRLSHNAEQRPIGPLMRTLFQLREWFTENGVSCDNDMQLIHRYYQFLEPYPVIPNPYAAAPIRGVLTNYDVHYAVDRMNLWARTAKLPSLQYPPMWAGCLELQEPGAFQGKTYQILDDTPLKLHATYIEKLEKMREKKEYYEATFLLFTKAGLKQFGVLPYDDEHSEYWANIESFLRELPSMDVIGLIMSVLEENLESAKFITNYVTMHEEYMQIKEELAQTEEIIKRF